MKTNAYFKYIKYKYVSTYKSIHILYLIIRCYCAGKAIIMRYVIHGYKEGKKEANIIRDKYKKEKTIVS